MNPPSEKVSQTPQSSASSPTPPSEPAAPPMEESPALQSPKRPAPAAKTPGKAAKSSGMLEIVSHSSAKAKAAQAVSGKNTDPASATPDSPDTLFPTPSTTTASKGAEVEGTNARTNDTTPTTEGKEKDRNHPISPPSEPMQYRAIGLVRGLYTASEEQVTRGTIHTTDGSVIDAVLLGRVISLIKKHIDLTKEHLWVVYPRTREEGDSLHMQVVGIWEPESLSKEGEDEPAITAATPADLPELTPSEIAEPLASLKVAELASATSDLVPQPNVAKAEEIEADIVPTPEGGVAPVAASELPDGFFSIRGEIVHYAQETEKLVVKIKQQPRKASQRPKAFKLTLKGTLDSPKVLRHFWDLEVQREGNDLVVQKGTLIGIIPPVKKRPSQGDRNFQKKRPPNGNKKPFKRPRQSAGPEKAGEAEMPRSSPKPKPMKRNDPDRRSPRVPRNPL
ncbi:hypothetical protein [Trichothermofontia sp.]